MLTNATSNHYNVVSVHIASRRRPPMTVQSRPDSSNPHNDSFDAIVIGSGMGALAFASLMARLRKWRVLVLERHFKIGGFTHTFSRPGGWTWDAGVHYVGEMGEGMTGRRPFHFINGGGGERGAPSGCLRCLHVSGPHL